jgi:hypothetical protein
MHTAKIINSLGLVCDIVGALLIWKFGLPETIDRSGAGFLQLEQIDEAQIIKGRLYDRWARIGIAVLVLGFILQLASNLIGW